MDKEKGTHAITDQNHILHSRADFALKAGQDASMDALFVQSAEQNHQHLIGSVRSKWHRETGCMKGLSAACSVCTPPDLTCTATVGCL